MALNNGSGHMPALGFGTLIPDLALTRTATRDALEAGFRHFDGAERYRNEREVGEALQRHFLPRPELRSGRERISISPPFLKARWIRSIALRSDRGSTMW